MSDLKKCDSPEWVSLHSVERSDWSDPRSKMLMARPGSSRIYGILTKRTLSISSQYWDNT